jgi:glycerol uptake facilitator-like aquaporin
MMDERERVTLIGATVVSFVVTAAFGAVCFAVYFFEIPSGQKDLANVLFGFLGGAFGAVVGFWTGPVMNRSRKEDGR